ncbi:Afadin and alpha-actinin-binding-domain-containing protein [Hypoxylon crocopeplum]|nr:Afadin and alpha-actinin-binding-domain-containing protein [Hypoxylon crocopeplum]
MGDPDNLRTASLYINNQLMSRGLLRDGHNIDFANPESVDGGLQATMGKVMSIINDLILRRDRDAENRESLSTTLRNLRADSQRQTTELARQNDKLADTQRKLDSSEATERALRTQLKVAEQNVNRLKDDAAKMKSLLTQARAACANEIRKRDRQIDGLKKAVTDAGRVRGGGKSRDVLCITVTGEVGGRERGLPAGATEAEGYSLHLETNEFLTELARGLSEENEGLLALVRRTVDGLRDMSGLERGVESVNGAPTSHNPGGNDNADVEVMAAQKSAEELAAELEAIMEHLRTILTNPSFVPIEEVEIRDDAIQRLRAGLETMESRWKDAVHMIDGWRKRMVSSGQPVDMEDLCLGLRLSPVRVRDVEETTDVVPMRLSCVHEEEEEHDNNSVEEEEEERRRPRSPSPVESLHLVPAPGYEVEENEDDSDSDSSSIFQDDIDIDELDVEEPNVQVLQESTYEGSIDSPPLPVPPQLSPLKDSYASGNRGLSGRGDQAYRKRPGDFTTIMEENTWDLAAEEEEEQAPAPPPHMIKPQQSPKQQQKITTSKRSPPWQEQVRPSSTSSYDSPLFGKSGERPSQSDPSRKLFSRPTSSIGQPAQTKSQPEPGSAVQTAKSRRPASSRESPDPLASETKRTASDPTNPPSHQQASSMSSRPAPSTMQSQPTPSSSSSKTNTAIGQQQQPSSRPRSPIRMVNQLITTTTTSSRLPRPNINNPPPQSPLTMATIAAKLAAAERDADAARVRAKLRAVRNGGHQRRTHAVAATTTTTTQLAPTPTAAGSSSPSEKGEEQREENNNNYDSVDPVKRDRNPAPAPTPQDPAPQAAVCEGTRERRRKKPVVEDDTAADELAASHNGNENEDGDGNRNGNGINSKPRRKRDPARRTSKVASRRRSTLSPWELETLMQGNAAAAVNCG